MLHTFCLFVCCFHPKWLLLYSTYFIFYFFIFIFGSVGSSFLCEGFLQLQQAGATLYRGARASHYRGLSCCGAQAPDAQAQQLWLTGPAAPRHVGPSQTRARTPVPCIGRQILNPCATREALASTLYILKYSTLSFDFQIQRVSQPGLKIKDLRRQIFP